MHRERNRMREGDRERERQRYIEGNVDTNDIFCKSNEIDSKNDDRAQAHKRVLTRKTIHNQIEPIQTKMEKSEELK